MSSTDCEIPVGELHRFVPEVCAALGCDSGDAEWMARMIVSSEAAGHPSHGLRRLVEYAADASAGLIDPKARVHVVRDSGSTLALDGARAFGHVAMRDLTTIVIERARRYGVCAVTMRGSDYVGRFADYCEWAADEGVVVVCFANDSGAGQDVAPFGTDSPRLATNPIAAGVPRSRSPHLVIDLATSVVAAGRVAEERDRGMEIPGEWVTASGALRPAGGVKGFALALLVEALAGGLSEAGTVRPDPSGAGQGLFVVGVDVAAFRDPGEFAADVEGFLDHVRSAGDEGHPVRVPGDRTTSARSETVVVAAHTLERLRELGQRLGIAPPESV